MGLTVHHTVRHRPEKNKSLMFRYRIISKVMFFFPPKSSFVAFIKLKKHSSVHQNELLVLGYQVRDTTRFLQEALLSAGGLQNRKSQGIIDGDSVLSPVL